MKENLKKLQEIAEDCEKEIENLKKEVSSQEMNKEQEEKIISEITVQEQYKQFLMAQKNDKNKEVSQITAKTEEIYMEVPQKFTIFSKKNINFSLD